MRTLIAVAMIGAFLGCAVAPYAPYAPKSPNGLTPPGESIPVRGADPNPLSTPQQVVVICSPQGLPITVSREVTECETDTACRVECDPDRSLEQSSQPDADD